MKIGIDNRERDRISLFDAYIKAGKTRFIDDIILDNYSVGDYRTMESLVGVEFKEEDLVESIFSGLLDKQLLELKATFQYPYLVLGYDGIQDMIQRNIGVNPDVLIGAYTSLLVRHHIPIVFTSGNTVKVIIDLIEKHYDGKNEIKKTEYTSIRNKSGKKKPSVIEIKTAVLSHNIPRLGPKIGSKLMTKYNNSFQQIAQAPLEELMEMKGIGEELAKRIKEVLA